MKAQSPRVGIALDSGGAKGGAHIGVMDALLENDIPIDIVVGSSAGAFAGALYATGTIDVFKEIISDMSLLESLGYYLDPVFPVSGILAGKRARAFIQGIIGDVMIEDLEMGFVAVATDLLSGETVAIDRGPVVDAVMASVSMPGIFKPFVHMERLLTDGGVSDPLPVDVLKDYGPTISIACNLHPHLAGRYSRNEQRAIITAEKEGPDEDIPSWYLNRLTNALMSQHIFDGVKPLVKNIRKKINTSYTELIRESDLVNALQEQLSSSKERLGALIEGSIFHRDDANQLNIFEIMMISTNIQQYQKNKLILSRERPDILIEPDVTHIGSLEFSRVNETIAEGRARTLAALPRLQELLQ